MKKYLFFTTLVVLAAFLVGCGGDTELRWANQSDASVSDIQWMGTAGVDQTWDGETPDRSKTDLKGVNLLTGQGECIDFTGETAQIFMGTATTARLSEGEANELTITQTMAKKKRSGFEINENTEIIDAKVISRDE